MTACSGITDRRDPASFSRGGYTLLEMVLAIGVLVVLASLAAGPLMKSWRDQRLGRAAEDVRGLAAGTRIRALDDSEAWQFRFEPGGRHYVRVRWMEPQNNSASGTDSTSTDSVQNGGGTAGQSLSGTLPDGIIFGSDDSGSGSGSLSPRLLEGLPDAGDLGQVSWSAPIVFQPDGTAVTTRFHVFDDEAGGSRTISVRELTGAVSVIRSDSVSGL